MISLKEIGRICGLSESTVSKALKGNPAIRRATVERVTEVARKYGYQPNAAVQCMQTGQSRSIGIAYNNFCCQFAGQVMEGIQQVLHENNYDSFVIQWDKLVKDKIGLLVKQQNKQLFLQADKDGAGWTACCSFRRSRPIPVNGLRNCVTSTAPSW